MQLSLDGLQRSLSRVGAGSSATSIRSCSARRGAHWRSGGSAAHDIEEVVMKTQVVRHLRMERGSQERALPYRHNRPAARIAAVLQPRQDLHVGRGPLDGGGANEKRTGPWRAQ